MRVLALCIVVFAAACGGGGGGGSAAPRIELRALSFSVVRADVTTTRAIELLSPFSEQTVLELVEPATGGFVAEPSAFLGALGPSRSRIVDVTFTPGVEAAAAGSMLVRFRSGEETHLVRVDFDAAIEMPTIALLAQQVSLGDVYVDESDTRTVTVRNTSAVTPVRLSTLASLPQGLRVIDGLGTIPAGVATDLTVEWAPTALATHDLAIVFQHDASGPPLSLRVTAQATTWRPEQITDFGTIALTGGESDWLEVEAPPHGISVSIEAVAAGMEIGLLGLEGPGGHIYENDTATGEFLWFTGDEVFTATVPSSDRTQLRMVPGGGTYRFRLYRFGGTGDTIDVRAIVHNRVAAVAQGGVVDLNVFLADGLNIDVLDAPTETRLQAILDEADRIFGQHDLSLGNVTYFALTDPGFDRITSSSEFGDLLEESERGVEGRLNLFFVEQTLSGGAVGVAARVAGPLLAGTRESGVMVDYDWGSTAQSGYVTAHELGHYLGLLHTTEEDGSHDLIDDTLECPKSGTNPTCTTEGNANLMHWRVLGTDPKITDGQALVLLGHPLVAPSSPSLTAFESERPSSPILASAVPQGWCGTSGCCSAAK